MASSSIVLKVKYGDTLRRFIALIDEDQHLDLDMERLRTKICSLFNLTPGADFVLTYIDEDNDQVTLADDDDLYDVMRQGLNPVRITVHVNVEKSNPSSPELTGSSTLRRSSSQTSRQDKNPIATEILKSVPEPLSDALSKLSLELASKAATTSPVLADLLNTVSKMGLPYLTAACTPSGSTPISSHEAHDPQNTSGRDKHGAFNDVGVKPDGGQGSTSEQPTPGQMSWSEAVRQEELLRNPQQPPCLLNKGKSVRHFHYMPTGDSGKKDADIKENFSKRSGANVFEYLSSKKDTNQAKNPMGECPFSGIPLQPDIGQASHMPPPVQPFKRSFRHSADGIGSMFHKGVRCDGCGVLPITGPRFKSKIKYDYDLCSICFARIGNDADYARIDFPLRCRHPWKFKGFYNPMLTHLPSVQVQSKGSCGAKNYRPRLNSSFVADINVMDGTLMAPSTPFTKIWRMHNNGTLPWLHGIRLLWIGGDNFGTSDSIEIEVPVKGVNVGTEIDIAGDFIAPKRPGRYISYWRMADEDNQQFGQRVWVLIEVDDGLSESASVLESDQQPENAGPSASESLHIDLNLPPENAGPLSHQSSPFNNLNVDMNSEHSEDAEAGDLYSALKGGEQSMTEQKRKIETEEMNFPINDDLLVANDGSYPANNSSIPVVSPFFYPATDIPSFTTASSATPSPTSAHKPAYPTPPDFSYLITNTNIEHVPESAAGQVSYPTVEVSEEILITPSKDKSGGVAGSNEVEETLLKELEAMGFKEVELNKEVLRTNEYDLERSVDELCGVSGWDHILEDLREMGFQDKETNKKLLTKNNGSITRVVMDLIAEEKE